VTLVVVSALLLVALVIGASVWQAKQAEKEPRTLTLADTWRKLAAERGGAAPPGWLYLRVGEARVALDLYELSASSNQRMVCMRAFAPFVLGAGPVFAIVPESGIFESSDEISFGDPAFDGVFRVTADDPAALRALLSPRLRQLVVSDGNVRRVTSNGESVVVLADMPSASPARSLALAELVGTLASWGAEALETLRALPGARPVAVAVVGPIEGTSTEDLASVDVPGKTGLVRVTARVAGGVPGFGVRASAGGALASVSLDLGDAGVTLPPELGSVLDDGARDLVRRVGAAHLEAGPERVELALPGPCDGRRLEAAVGLADALGAAVPRQGAFR